MVRCSRLLALALFGGLFSIWATAQDSNNARDSSVFRSDTLAVDVPIIVRDKKTKQPVRDLKPEDFTLTVQGKTVPVEWFSAIDSRQLPLQSATGVKVPDGFVSNRKNLDGERGSVVVVVVDAINARFDDAFLAMKAALTELEGLPPQDQVGVCVMSRLGVSALHDYSEDRMHFLKRLRNASSFRDLLQERTELEAALGTVGGAYPQANHDAKAAVYLRLMYTMRGLQGVAESLRYLPGRKSMVWLSGGFNMFAVDDNRAMWNRALARIASANVAVYAIDAMGLRAQSGMSAEFGRAGETVNRTTSATLPLRMVAERTGGKLYINRGDLAPALRQAIDDSAQVYILGFTARDPEWKGDYRRIRVKVNRPGVDLSYREGYLESKTAATTDEEANRMVQDAMSGSVSATGIPLSARVNGDGSERQLVLLIDPSDSAFQQQADLFTGGYRLRVAACDEGGKVLEDLSDQISLRLNAAQVDRAKTDGFRYLRVLTKSNGVRYVKVAVLNLVSGKVGSVTIPVGPVSKDGGTILPEYLDLHPESLGPSSISDRNTVITKTKKG